MAVGCRAWSEDERLKWLQSELTGKRPLLPPGMATTAEVAEVLSTFRILAELPPDSLGAYIISMAHTGSDVLAVVLLQVHFLFLFVYSLASVGSFLLMAGSPSYFAAIPCSFIRVVASLVLLVRDLLSSAEYLSSLLCLLCWAAACQ